MARDLNATGNILNFGLNKNEYKRIVTRKDGRTRTDTLVGAASDFPNGKEQPRKQESPSAGRSLD